MVLTGLWPATRAGKSDAVTYVESPVWHAELLSALIASHIVFDISTCVRTRLEVSPGYRILTLS